MVTYILASHLAVLQYTMTSLVGVVIDINILFKNSPGCDSLLKSVFSPLFSGPALPAAIS